MKALSRSIPLTGFILLTVMVMVLLLTATNTAWITHPAAGIIASVVTLGTLIAIYYEGKGITSREIKPVSISRKFFEFLAVVIGGVATFYLSYEIGMGVVIGSCLVGILAQMVFPEYGVPAYCGAFVGMSSNALLFNYWEVAIASAIAGIVYVLARDVFGGFGGKLGTIAFIGATLTGFGFARNFIVAPIADFNTSLWILGIAFIAAPLTFYLNCNLDNGPVLASGVVGLAGGLILPVLFPDIGNTLAVVAVCASFTGMSNTQRCLKFWHILVAGLFTGILFVFSTPLLGGAGGKLGTIAFASIISTHGFIKLYQRSHGIDTTTCQINQGNKTKPSAKA